MEAQRDCIYVLGARNGSDPAALLGMVVGMGVKYGDFIASVTFLAVLLTILLQAGTTAYVARRLGLEEKADGET